MSKLLEKLFSRKKKEEEITDYSDISQILKAINSGDYLVAYVDDEILNALKERHGERYNETMFKLGDLLADYVKEKGKILYKGVIYVVERDCPPLSDDEFSVLWSALLRYSGMTFSEKHDVSSALYIALTTNKPFIAVSRKELTEYGYNLS